MRLEGSGTTVRLLLITVRVPSPGTVSRGASRSLGSVISRKVAAVGGQNASLPEIGTELDLSS
jgi:hypothetical protein